jgi:hypothetical protein
LADGVGEDPEDSSDRTSTLWIRGLSAGAQQAGTDGVPIAPTLSKGVGLLGQAALGAIEIGPAIRGLSPNPPPSVALSGIEPSTNSDPLMTPGLGAGELATQLPDIADVPNPAGAFVVASVASTGISALDPAVSAVGQI